MSDACLLLRGHNILDHRWVSFVCRIDKMVEEQGDTAASIDISDLSFGIFGEDIEILINERYQPSFIIELI